MEKLKAGDHVKVRGVVSSDYGDDYLLVRFEKYGSSANVPRESVEFLHGDFKVHDEVIYRHNVLGDVPGVVLAINGTGAWVRLTEGRGDVIAKFEEMSGAPIAEAQEIDIPPAPAEPIAIAEPTTAVDEDGPQF